MTAEPGPWRNERTPYLIGIMDANTYTEFGTFQVVEWTHAPLYAEGRRVRLNSVELVVKTQ